MVSRGLEGVLYSTESSSAVVSDRAGLAVAKSPRSNNSATECVNNPLMSEANPQCRGLVAHFSEDGRARPKVPGIAGGAWARRDYDPIR